MLVPIVSIFARTVAWIGPGTHRVPTVEERCIA